MSEGTDGTTTAAAPEPPKAKRLRITAKSLLREPKREEGDKALGQPPGQARGAFMGATTRLAQSEQIPAKVIEKLRNEIVEPPLGERSFEELGSLLLASTDVATVVSQISSDVVGGGWHLVPINDKVPIDAAEQAKAQALLENESSQVTIGEVLRAVWTDHESLGNAWFELLRAGNRPEGEPTGFAHAPGLTMRLRSNLNGFVQLSLDDRYVTFFRTLFSDPSAETSKYPAAHPKAGATMNEMIFLREYHSGSPWYGIPRVVPAITAIKGSLLSAERNLQFFTNRAMPEWAIIVAGETDNIDEDDLRIFKEEIEEYFRNVLKGDNYRTLYLEIPKGITVTFEKVGGEINDADHKEYRRDNRDEILRAYQMMPNRVGIIEAGNIGGGTGESQIEIYKNSVVRPRQEKLERVINQILRAPTPKGLGLKTVAFRFNELDTFDEAREATIAETLGRAGYLSINEGRRYTAGFLRLQLEDYPFEWADLPLPIVLATMSGDPLAFQPQGGENGNGLPALSPLGTALPPSGEKVRQEVKDQILVAIDRVYKKGQERRAPSGFTRGEPLT